MHTKCFMLVFLLAFLSSAVCWASGTMPSAEFNIGGVTLGATPDYVHSIYGEPTTQQKDDETNYIKLEENYGDKLRLVYFLDKTTHEPYCDRLQVVFVGISADNLATPSGIRVGDNIRKVTDKYGTPDGGKPYADKQHNLLRYDYMLEEETSMAYMIFLTDDVNKEIKEIWLVSGGGNTLISAH